MLRCCSQVNPLLGQHQVAPSDLRRVRTADTEVATVQHGVSRGLTDVTLHGGKFIGQIRT